MRADLLVDGVEHLVGNPGHAGLAVAGKHRDRPDPLGHTPAAGHRPGDAGAGLQVALGAGRHDAEDLLLGGHPAERADDPALQVGHVVAVAVGLGVDRVTPSARPRGMIETLRTGSAPGWSMPSRAWPASW
jgi:hypothetical protein